MMKKSKVGFRITLEGHLWIKYSDSDGGMLSVRYYKKDDKLDERCTDLWAMNVMNGKGLGYGSYPKTLDEIIDTVKKQVWISDEDKAKLVTILESIDY